jgi:IstB-like ATP binding protein
VSTSGAGGLITTPAGAILHPTGDGVPAARRTGFSGITTRSRSCRRAPWARRYGRLDRVVTDAAARNLSPAATLERRADLELEGRQSRSVERRFRLSKLQARHGIESFNFNHHKSSAADKKQDPALRA